MFYDKLTKRQGLEPTSALQFTVASILLVVMILCPYVFLSTLIVNRNKLGEPETKAKFGALYTGLKAASDPRVLSYSFIFMIRRFLFVLLTFLIFDQPGI